MAVLTETSRIICSFLYLALGNRITDRLFWRAINGKSTSMQHFACVLRHRQINLLSYLESKLDLDLLYSLVTKLETLLSDFQPIYDDKTVSRKSAHCEDNLPFAGVSDSTFYGLTDERDYFCN